MLISQKKILFIYLNAFSSTGGIEKFNTCFMKSIYENNSSIDFNYQNISLIDSDSNIKFLPQNLLKGFNGNKLLAILYAMIRIMTADIVLLGHVNLLVLALYSFLFPKKKIVLIAHGIEVWQDLAKWKQKVLQKCDLILAVSNYTKQQIIAKHQVDTEKIIVFPNTINPFLSFPNVFNKPEYLLNRYNLKPNDKILLTLARLSSAEKYKGYDKIIKALPLIVKKYPNIKYILAGKYDEVEYQRIIKLIKELGVSDYVILTGFIKDEELTDHYLMADIFTMPSQGEGFGIVYLEAMACGVPVVAGNVDGSVDALKNGELGKLVNPENVEEIANTLIKELQNLPNAEQKLALQQKVIQYFGFEQFKKQTFEVINYLLK